MGKVLVSIRFLPRSWSSPSWLMNYILYLICILVQTSNRSARILLIFQETQNSKISENSGNKTGDYSPFKITKIYFQKKASCNFFGKKKWKVPYQNTRLQFHNCWLSRVLDIQNHTFFHCFWMEKSVDLLVSEFFLCCDLSVIMFSSKGKGFCLPLV